DGHRHGGGVDAPRGLGLGDPLDAMDAALELEAAVDAVPGDLDDDLLDAAESGRVVGEDLGLPPVALGVAVVHPVELLGEERRLVAARAGPDLEKDVLLVVRVLREEQRLELALEPLHLPDQRELLFLGELAHPLVLGLADERLRLVELLYRAAVLAVLR